MWYFTGKKYLDHDTGVGHPERPDRLLAIWKALETALPKEALQHQPYVPASVESVGRVHTAGMLKHTSSLASQGGGLLTADTPIVAASPDIAFLAAGAACAAVDSVLEIPAKSTKAFCAIRPPGHHATPDKAMGFCLVNSAAVAARHAQAKHGLDRVLIFDWDVHHGNGTQDIFYQDPSVGFISIHRHGQGFYPGTGSPEETGSGAGLGTTWNLAVQPGISRKLYLDKMDRAIDFARSFRPQLVILSAGFDACQDDPVGDIGLDPAIFGSLTRRLVRLVNDSAGGRLVSLLEGGYNLKQLGLAVTHHVEALVKA